MSEVAKSLRDRRQNVWSQAREIADRAVEENRALTAEEQGSWDAANEELNNLDARIKAVLEAEKRSKAADEAFNSINGKQVDVQRQAGRPDAGGQGGANGDANSELRAWFRGDQGTPKTLDLRHDPARGPVSYRNLVTFSAASGGALTPTDFYDQLIAHLVEVSGLLQAGPTILNTAGGESLVIPRTTQHSTAALTAQVGTISESDPQFSTVTLNAFKYGVLLSVARELLDDSGVDLIGYLAMQAGRAIGNAFGADLITGNGTGKPNGLLNLATLGVTSGNTGKSGALVYSDLVNLEYSVIAPYRQSRSCYWIAADKTVGSFRLIVDSNGRPVWEPSMVLGSPDLLLGKPLVADPFMPALATGSKSVVFGDFAQFFVRLVGPVRFERSDDFAFNTDLVTFRAVIRGDGTLVDQTGACMKYAAGAAT
jgi:HK97 family phage major capsid protein